MQSQQKGIKNLWGSLMSRRALATYIEYLLLLANLVHFNDGFVAAII